MLVARNAGEISRVLIALQGGEPASGPMAAALQLATSMQAELAGLFVEDVDLLRLAALPFTREVGLASAVVRPLETADIERTLRRQAEELREWLGGLAAESRLKWSFQVARGRLVEQVMAAAQQADLIVVGERPRPAARSSGAAAPRRDERKVMALFDATEAGRRALSAALSLSQGQPQLLSLLVPAVSDAGVKALRELAARQLQIAPELPRVVTLRSPEAGELARQARQQGSALLVVSVRSLPEDPAQLRVLLQTSDCPLVLVF
jgi:hypothetical protein